MRLPQRFHSVRSFRASFRSFVDCAVCLSLQLCAKGTLSRWTSMNCFLADFVQVSGVHCCVNMLQDKPFEPMVLLRQLSQMRQRVPMVHQYSRDGLAVPFRYRTIIAARREAAIGTIEGIPTTQSTCFSVRCVCIERGTRPLLSLTHESADHENQQQQRAALYGFHVNHVTAP